MTRVELASGLNESSTCRKHEFHDCQQRQACIQRLCEGVRSGLEIATKARILKSGGGRFCTALTRAAISSSVHTKCATETIAVLARVVACKMVMSSSADASAAAAASTSPRRS
eukprot:664864-Pleurochrysis_carterae.AAC.1